VNRRISIADFRASRSTASAAAFGPRYGMRNLHDSLG